MATGVAKLTISLPNDILAITDEIAAEKNISRSRLVSLCLHDLAKQRLKQKMEEGYRALSKDNAKFAGQAIVISHEVISGQE